MNAPVMPGIEGCHLREASHEATQTNDIYMSLLISHKARIAL